MSFEPKKIADNQWMVRCGLCGDKVFPKRHFVSHESPALALAEAEKYAAQHRGSPEHRAAVTAYGETPPVGLSPEDELLMKVFGHPAPDLLALKRRAARAAAWQAHRVRA